jgi:hypothetical protein
MLNDTLAVFYRLKILRYYDDSNKRKEVWPGIEFSSEHWMRNLNWKAINGPS